MTESPTESKYVTLRLARRLLLVALKVASHLWAFARSYRWAVLLGLMVGLVPAIHTLVVVVVLRRWPWSFGPLDHITTEPGWFIMEDLLGQDAFIQSTDCSWGCHVRTWTALFALNFVGWIALFAAVNWLVRLVWPRRAVGSNGGP